MTNLREAAQMALDVLDKLNKDGWILADFEDEVCASIEALRAALAQPEQEPVAWIKARELTYMKAVVEHGATDWKTNLGLKPEDGDVPLYTAPPQQPEPEQVAWITTWNEPNDAGVELHWVKQHKGLSSKHTPLYTAPPQRECCCGDSSELGVVHRADAPCFHYEQREWVGLTLEEMHELEKEFLGWPVDQVGMLLIHAAQDKLKEKNT